VGCFLELVLGADVVAGCNPHLVDKLLLSGWGLLLRLLGFLDQICHPCHQAVGNRLLPGINVLPMALKDDC
jgi:hypothetical protein